MRQRSLILLREHRQLAVASIAGLSALAAATVAAGFFVFGGGGGESPERRVLATSTPMSIVIPPTATPADTPPPPPPTLATAGPTKECPQCSPTQTPAPQQASGGPDEPQAPDGPASYG